MDDKTVTIKSLHFDKYLKVLDTCASLQSEMKVSWTWAYIHGEVRSFLTAEAVIHKAENGDGYCCTPVKLSRVSSSVPAVLEVEAEQSFNLWHSDLILRSHLYISPPNSCVYSDLLRTFFLSARRICPKSPRCTVSQKFTKSSPWLNCFECHIIVIVRWVLICHTYF